MKLSDLSPMDWFTRLNLRRLRYRAQHAANWRYYFGEQPLNYIARILREQQDRFPALIINWPGLVIDALDERLTIEGFALGDSDSVDDDIAGMWQSNGLDAVSSEAHICSLVTREAYLMVGPGAGAYPRLTVEYPEQVAVETDPRSRRVMAALQTWRSDENLPTEDMGELMLPGHSYVFELGDMRSQSLGWAQVDQNDQTSPMVPVVPMLNRPHRGYGRTELHDIKSPADAANQIATNMMAGIEHHALPRRWAVGAREADFVDPKTGKPLPAWAIATGPVWAVTSEDAQDNQYTRLGQFSASDMTNFHNSIKLLASIAGTLYGLPAHYMAYTTDNPVSAEAILYSEARLVKRAERRQVTFGEPWEQGVRIGLDIMGRDPSTAIKLETVWRDASTPTAASKVQAAVQALQVGLFDEEYARQFIGMSIAARAAIAQRQASTGGLGQTIAAGLRALNVAGGQPPTPPAQVPPAPAGQPAPDPTAAVDALQPHVSNASRAGAWPQGLGPLAITQTANGGVGSATGIGR